VPPPQPPEHEPQLPTLHPHALFCVHDLLVLGLLALHKLLATLPWGPEQLNERVWLPSPQLVEQPLQLPVDQPQPEEAVHDLLASGFWPEQ